MIELRWKEVHKTITVPLNPDIIGDMRTIEQKVRKKILQYRQMKNINEIDLHPPVWGDWLDVPTHKEDE